MEAELLDSECVISVSGLARSFGSNRAVDAISFTVRKGEVFALLGPNGAGKTTTVSMLEGLLKRDSGSVSILGLDPWEDLDRLKLRIGVMPQDFSFFESLSAMDSVRFYCELFNSSANPEELLSLVLLGDAGATPFGKLSGGQKQKLGLALSLVNDPEILFLDEPTTGLDPSARRAIWSIIQGFRESGKTVILTTHYMEEAEQLADRIAIINHGRIAAEGSPDEIIGKHGTGRKLVLKGSPLMPSFLLGKGIEFTERNGNVEIDLREDGKIADIVRLIEDSGVAYSQLTVRTDSLEDVFVRLVGEMTEGILK